MAAGQWVIVLLVATAASTVAVDGTSGPDELAQLPTVLIPSHHFDWHDVRAAAEPVLFSLGATPWGTCFGHISTRIDMPYDAAIRGFTTSPVDGKRCTFSIVAREGDEVDQTPQVETAPDACCGVKARFRAADGSLHAEPPTARMVGTAAADIEAAKQALAQRIAERWTVWEQLHGPTDLPFPGAPTR